MTAIPVMILAVGAGLAVGRPARAADNPTDAQQSAEMAHKLTSSLMQPISEILPVTPERQRLARDLVVRVTTEAATNALSEALLSEALDKFAVKIKALPPHQQALTKAAFSKAFRTVQSKRLPAVRDSMQAYFAARLSEDDLKALLALYDNDTFRRMQTDPQSVTPEQRQALGRYAMDHPVVLKLGQLSIGYASLQQAQAATLQAAFAADFQVQFCQDLAAEGIRSPACPASGLSGLMQAVAPAGRGVVPAASVRWLSKPQGSAFAQYYPERAQRMGASGAVQATCTVADDRTLSNCAIAAEQPEGFGFGEALIKLAHFYKAAPETPAGLQVAIAMNFALRR